MSFYEKYKRPIIIGVALFALVTFSVTGVMLTVIQDVFRPNSGEKVKLADDRQVSLTQEDYAFGQQLRALHGLVRAKDQMFGRPGGLQVAMPAFVFAGLNPGDTDSQTFAILRRAALERGIDVADEEVDAALAFALEERKSPFQQQPQPNQPETPKITPLMLARGIRAGSVVQLKSVIREAIRVSTLVRTEMLAALDLSDAALADYIKKERKRVSLSYVGWDGKQFEEELKRIPPTNQDIEAWIAEQPENDKAQYMHEVVLSFDRVGLVYDQADPKDFEDLIKDAVIGDAEVEARYNQDRERLYKKEVPKKPETPKEKDGDKPGGGKKPEEDKQPKKPEDNEKDKKKNEGKDEDGGLLQDTGKNADQKSDQNNADAKSDEKSEEQSDAKKPASETSGPQGPDAPSQVDPKNDTQQPIGPVTAEQAAYVPLAEVKESILKKLKLDAAMRKLHEQAKAAYDEAQKAITEHNKKDDEKKDDEKKSDDKDEKKKSDDAKDPDKKQEENKEDKDAKSAEAPKPFDLKAWFDEVSKGRKGFVYVPAGAEAAPPEQFQDAEPFGFWPNSWVLRSLEDVGSLAGNAEIADKGTFVLQLKSRQTKVMKPTDEIRDQALESYYLTESTKKAKEKADEFRKLVRTKAEELKADEVKKLKDAIAGKVAKQLGEWEKKIQDSVAKLGKRLASGNIPESAKVALQKKIDKHNADLAKKDEQSKSFKEAIEAEVDEEIGVLVEPVLGEATAKAAEAAKVELKTLGPFFMDEQTRNPLFNLLDAGAEKFLKQQVSTIEQKLKQDEDGKELPKDEQRKLEKGVVTDPIEDTGERAFYVVRIDGVEDGGSQSVTRRTLASMRPEFNDKRVRNVLEYGFGLKAIKKRYGFITK